MTTRRDFIKRSGVALGGYAALHHIPGLPAGFDPPDAGTVLPLVNIPSDDQIRALMADAIGAARGAGASYSDVRIGRYQNNFVITREQQIVQVVDTDSMGAGVRALVDGTWGFAATRALTPDGVAAAAREAVAIARANRVA
ncbi:MAG: PmbA/TldA family metallopeptidase [Gemmatimonadaceae bacterium]